MSNPNFGFDTTAEEVTSTYANQIKGKTILITGTSPGGIGESTAKSLALHSPALIILATRSTSALQATAITLKSISPNTPVKTLELDLNNLRKVREAAAVVNSWDDVPRIDILINNAGLMAWDYELNGDGIEKQFATNHVGPFLFTNLILPKVVAAKGRIVNVASAGHRFSPVRFEDWNFGDGKDFDPQAGYGQSKTANMLHAISLAEKLKHKEVTAFSVHPGRILTNMGRNVPIEVMRRMGLVNEDGTINLKNSHYKFKNHSQGSATTLVAALDLGIAERSGEYLSDCQIDHEIVSGELAAERGTIREAYALDTGNAKRLWDLSERLVGEKFDV